VLDWGKIHSATRAGRPEFFKAPKMTEWFAGRIETNDLYLRMNDKKICGDKRICRRE